MEDFSYDRINWHLPPERQDQLQCRKYLAIAFGCHTPKNHLRAWYANGEGANCKRERSNLYGCMRLKLARSETKEKILAENAAHNRAFFEVPSNHFWKARPEGVCPDSWPDPAGKS